MNIYQFQTRWKNLAFSCRNRKTCIRREKLGENFLCFTRPLDILEENHISQLIIFRQFRKKLKNHSACSRNFIGNFVKTAFSVSSETFCVYIFFLFSTEVIFLNYFQSLSEQENFRPFAPKFCLFWKNAFHLCIKVFLKKLFLWKKLMKFYLFCTMKEKFTYCRFLWLFCQLCILCDPRDCLGKVASFREKVILDKTSTLSETFLALWHICFGLVVKSAF